MSTSDSNKKYKRPKQKTLSTTKPETSRSKQNGDNDETPQPLCPLLAKDSEWVDILQAPLSDTASTSAAEEEAVLQLVECEDGPQMKPLAIMFPGLLDKDPQTLRGMLNKAMSTTEVTRHLVDLGQKANFTFMKKSNRLIPRDKQWLESLPETSNSNYSLVSDLFNSSLSSDYEADNEIADDFEQRIRKKRKKINPMTDHDIENLSSQGSIQTFQGKQDKVNINHR